MDREKIKNRFSALTMREKVTVAAAVLLAVLVVPYVFLYSPSAKKVEEEKAVLKTLRTEVDGLQAAAASLPAEQGMRTEKITLPASEDLAGTLSGIIKEASLSHVEFISLVPEGLTPKDGYLEMKLKMELKVGFKALHDFLRGIESRQRLFVVREMRFETNDAVYPSGLAVLRATAYMRKP
jgi:type II secretory pathway component PulM